MSNTDKIKKKKEKKTKSSAVSRHQGQNLLQTLGIKPEEQVEIEKKLRLIKYFDLFSEQTFDLIYKDKFLENQFTEFSKWLESLGTMREEDKLIKQNYEAKQIKEIIYNLKSKAEKIASKNGYEIPFAKRYRNYYLLMTVPILAVFSVLTVLQLFGINLMLFFFPLLCLVCFGPQMLKASLLKKWHDSKEQHKNDLYTESREDIVILKEFTNDILESIRQSLLEKKIPLQIIKFQLMSSDYDNLKVLGKFPIRNVPGEIQYLVSFEYPPGMEPFPIPEEFKQAEEAKNPKKEEKNFIVFSELKANNGVISSFIPSLKDIIAEEINKALNSCDFNEAPEKIDSIIPGYSKEMAIYCKCGEIAKISSVQICNWKNQFKFYLFEGKTCKCGEKVYALSLMDDNDDVPEELKVIFSN